MAQAFIGLGTNIGDRKENINMAVKALSLLPETKVLDVSNLYETAPWGYKNQQNFVNAAVKIETNLSPEALLGACLGIEAAMGRVRLIKNGPRVVDLDLLLYDNVIRNTEELTLPHPRMMERAFVLKPLIDILPTTEFLKALLDTDQSQVWLYEA